MPRRKLNFVTDIKSEKDLKLVKLQKKYALDVKKIELEASLLHMKMNLSPENIKDTLVEEGQSFLRRNLGNIVPSILSRLFKK